MTPPPRQTLNILKNNCRDNQSIGQHKKKFQCVSPMYHTYAIIEGSTVIGQTHMAVMTSRTTSNQIFYCYTKISRNTRYKMP